ncbi:MAG: hypothetical protein Q7S51_08225, partial [Gallionellaceae bacterium]|nr:hypothetical protein [Gallionellaceae bacterium]
MKTFLLTPAIALLNQLPYRRKFILISVAIFIPLAVLTYLFVSSLNDSITFNAKERTGIEYIKVARTLLLQVQNHLNVSDAALNDVWAGIGLNAQQELVDVALKAVEAVDQKLGGPDKLNTAEKWPPVKEKWQSLKDQTLSIKDNLGTHAALLGDITALIAHVGDTSNLILDPDLDTYYLMAQEVLRFPSIMNNLQQARMLGKEVLARKSMTSEEKTQLIFLFSRISADLDTIKNDIAVVFRENTAVKTELSTRFDTATTAISIFQDILGEKIIKAPQLVLSDYAYAEQASKAIGDVFKLYSAAEPI